MIFNIRIDNLAEKPRQRFSPYDSARFTITGEKDAPNTLVGVEFRFFGNRHLVDFGRVTGYTETSGEKATMQVYAVVTIFGVA